MACFEDSGFSKLELLDLNRVRLHQQVLFLLDVLSADGRSIEKNTPQSVGQNKNGQTVYFRKKDPQWLIWGCGIQRLRQ